jgi:DNA-directed RNA polymerase-3 subunit RPC5
MPVTKKDKKPSGEVKEVQVSARKVEDRGAQSQGGLSTIRREMLHTIRAEEDEDWEDLQFCDVTVCEIRFTLVHALNKNPQTIESEEAFESVFSRGEEALLCKTNITAFLKEIHGL